MVVLLVVLTIILFLLTELVYNYAKNRKTATESAKESGLWKELIEPEGLYYNPSHVWAFLKMDGTVALGLDHFFQQLIGKIDKITVPDVGTKLEKNTVSIVIEGGGRTVQARIPVDGTIDAINHEVLRKPELLLEDTYKNGWIIQVKPQHFMENAHELRFGEDAKQWISNEITRLRDFLGSHTAAKEPALQTMYDGGLPIHGIQSILDDSGWSEVKKNFLADESAS